MTIQISIVSRVSRDTQILCMISLVALLLTYTDFVIENKAIEGLISK